jgi:hypothetical protein
MIKVLARTSLKYNIHPIVTVCTDRRFKPPKSWSRFADKHGVELRVEGLRVMQERNLHDGDVVLVKNNNRELVGRLTSQGVVYEERSDM